MLKLTYKRAGDYLIPDLEVDGAEELDEMPLGKYGMLRETFLERHHHGKYTSMLLTGRLYPHLREIDRQAQEQVDRSRNEETGRRGRGDESPRPDGLGAGGQQLHGPGGGNGAGGDRLQINQEQREAAGEQPAASASAGPDLSLFSLFPTVEEQIETIAQVQAEERQRVPQDTPAPSGLVPSAVIRRALTSGGNENHSIEHIVAFFQKGPAGPAAASFMAEEFGKGGKGVKIAGQDYALWFDSEGFRIAPGRSAFGPGSTLVPWGGRRCHDCRPPAGRDVCHPGED